MINPINATQRFESLEKSAMHKQGYLPSELERESGSMAKKKILIVDHDTDLRAQLSVMLTNEGYWVKEAASSLEMDLVLNEFEADMIVLDVVLPDEDGLSILRRLRKKDSPDTIILSALCDVDHRVEGLSSGASYYLSKPVDMRELLAVIHNRFISLKKDALQQEKKWLLQTKYWKFTSPEGQSHTLNNTEFSLLHQLAKDARLGKATTKQALYDALDKTYLPQSRSLDLHISRLRQRFSKNNECLPLKTLRNVGYQLTESITVSFN